MHTVLVDFSQNTGKMKPMHAVNNGPVENLRGLGSKTAFMEAGIPCCRNHDAAFAEEYGGIHAHDVLNIFPDFDADENDPASYDFTLTDKSVRDIYEIGSTMFYRLGSKIEHEIKKYQTLPPKDFHKYARICEHIIRHYCFGWADGMEVPIVYWEIWNEPDLYRPDGSNPCWGGTMEQFYELYEIIAKHLKTCFPELKIGGPAFVGSGNGKKHVRDFICRMAERSIPVDFLSWHGYKTDPHDFEEYVIFVKELLAENGFEKTETILNEWNYVRGWRGEEMLESYRTMTNEKGMAFCAGSMLTMQKTALDMFMYYDARPRCAFNGLFKPYTYEILKPYYAFWQFNKLYQLENEVFSETDSRELFVGAAQKDGQAAVQIVYYSDEDMPNREVTICLKGLKDRTKIVGLLTDRDYDNKKVLEMTVPAGDTELVLDIKLHSTLLLTAEAV